MSLSFTPSQMIDICQCVSLYGDHTSDETLCNSYWKLPEQEQSAIANVSRAYYRFVREFAYYEALAPNGRWCGKGRSTLSAVRQYHRLLKDALVTLNTLRKQSDLG